MPDTKITALTAIGANPIIPSTFPIPMVDLTDTSMAASGTTKKVTVNQILGAGGTATLASATITGAATVGTTFGVTGVSTFAAGTALLPALTTTGDTNTGIYYPAADTFAVTTAGTERYRVDSSGNVGIGVTPSAWGIYKGLQVGYASLAGYAGSDTLLGSNVYFDGGAFKYIAAGLASSYRQLAGGHQWSTAVAGANPGDPLTLLPQMTLDASGNLLVGVTSTTTPGVGNTTAGGSLNANGAAFFSNAGSQALYLNTNVDGQIVSIHRSGVAVGSISVTTTGTAFNTSSDYRLKEAVQPLVGGLARVSALKPSVYKWKADGSNGEGFLAHELAEVVPLAVTGEKDAVNEDGSIKAQGVDLSKVVPVLVAAIQELTARVQTLETR